MEGAVFSGEQKGEIDMRQLVVWDQGRDDRVGYVSDHAKSG
jgi:hypothetical protein